MNAILSIKPQFVDEIKAGAKRYEYRKALFKRPVEKVYIYASAPVSRIIGEFHPLDVVSGTPEEVWTRTKQYSGIKKEWYDRYYEGRELAYAITIGDFKLYSMPIKPKLGFKAPQSFCYVDELGGI